MRITIEDVRKAIAELTVQGKSVSVAEIRKFLGRGSNSTILKFKQQLENEANSARAENSGDLVTFSEFNSLQLRVTTIENLLQFVTDNVMKIRSDVSSLVTSDGSDKEAAPVGDQSKLSEKLNALKHDHATQLAGLQNKLTAVQDQVEGLQSQHDSSEPAKKEAEPPPKKRGPQPKVATASKVKPQVEKPTKVAKSGDKTQNMINEVHRLAKKAQADGEARISLPCSTRMYLKVEDVDLFCQFKKLQSQGLNAYQIGKQLGMKSKNRAYSWFRCNW